jgi:hypothetical protein
MKIVAYRHQILRVYFLPGMLLAHLCFIKKKNLFKKFYLKKCLPSARFFAHKKAVAHFEEHRWWSHFAVLAKHSDSWFRGNHRRGCFFLMRRLIANSKLISLN